MTATARAIRAERHAEIGALLRRDTNLIIDRWAKRAVQEQPKAKRIHHETLLDHLPSFLAALGVQLEKEGDSDPCPYRGAANRHGEQRWETGWSLAEVIRDYQILRVVVFDYLAECLGRPIRVREVQAIGLALDEAIELSVERYVASRDEQFGRLEESVRKQTEDLRVMDRRKNEFLATLAHELRNPLAPLRNSLEVVRLSGDAPESAGQIREIMERQVQQLSRLVDDLLDVSRIAQGKLVLRKERLDLRPILEQAVQMSAPLVQERGHQLAVDLSAEPLWVEADQARLIQIVVNLLNNAAKYTPEGGRLRLAAGREGEGIIIRVRDNGVGIPIEKITFIFDLFTQLDPAADRAQGGLGIGLTLVRRLVELHGGRVAASSPGVGQGSEFAVWLPAAAAGLPSPSKPADGSKAVVGRHVLIVEDNRDSRQSLAMLLKLSGHRVDVAEDGPRGTQAGLALRPEVALIDIGLPGFDGYEVATRLRSALGESILLVALTGYSQPEDRQHAQEAGFDTHLVKPVDLDALRELLARGRS